MQQFKLLDLNEGKILELGKDFLYGGEEIYIKLTIQKDLKHNNQIFPKEYCIIQANFFNKTPLSQSTHTKLIPILEKTGAELFGDRYVLFKEFQGRIKEDVWYGEFRDISLKTGDIIWYYLPRYTQPQSCEAGTYIVNNYNNRKFNCNLELYVSKYIGNPIFEYTSLLKEEPNKFEEFCELVKR